MTKHRSRVTADEKQQLLELATTHYKNQKSSKEMLTAIIDEMYSETDSRTPEAVLKQLQNVKVLYIPAGKHYPSYCSPFERANKVNQPIVTKAANETSIQSEGEVQLGDATVIAKAIDSDLQTQLNDTRAELYNLYDSLSQVRPSLIFSNDGTATGKSYNVVESFLRPIHPDNLIDGFTNLLFTCPQKSQLELSQNHISEAQKKRVPINCIFALDDIANLELKHWSSKEVLRKAFERWINQLLNNNYFKTLGVNLKGAIKRVDAAKKQLVSAMFDDALDVRIVENIVYSAERGLREQLTKTARQLYSYYVEDKGSISSHRAFFTSQYISIDPMLISAVEMVNHVFPFESSKYCPTIMLLTARKLKTQVTTLKLSERSKDGLTTEQHAIENIVGHKCHSAEVRQNIDRLGSITNKPIEEQQEYLYDVRYLIDQDDYYLQNGIKFDLIIDEEHVTYPSFLNLGKHDILPSNDSVSDILSILYRINMSALNHRDGYSENWGESACEIIDEIKDHFTNRCEISEHCDFDSMIDLFAHKLHSPHIARQEVEQIINITRNVFAMTNKSFYNELELKKLRVSGVGAPGRHTGIKIYFQTDQYDKNPSLYDLFQLILCVFYVISKATHLDDYFKMFELQMDSEQNRPMRLFFNRIRQSRVDITNLFERANNEDQPIDHFFSYFLPKVVFSLQKLAELAAKPSQTDDDIFVTFKIELVESLPEDSLMRCLANTKNRAILLSATSGIRDGFNSSFNPELFKRFSTVNGEQRIHFYKRIENDVGTFDKLRALRSSCRNIEFYTHDDTSFQSKNDDELASQVQSFSNHIIQSANVASPYKISVHHKREIDITVKHMLSAALNQKHTMILSNSGTPARAIKEFAMAQAECISQLSPENYKGTDYGSIYKVFEFQPFEQGAKLRIVLFDAELNKKEDVVKQLSLTDDNTKICFISSYTSAGTGINVYKRYINEAINEDFERICLVNMGYWSSIKTKNDGFHHIFNAIYLYQKITSGKENILFKDVNLNFLEGKNFNALLNAHKLEQAFTLMQSLGRVERCDTNINTQVFLSEEIIQHMTLFFSYLERESQDLFIGSLSLLNHNFYQLTKQYAYSKSFETTVDRDLFKKETLESSKTVKGFFSEYVVPRLNDARKGDYTAIALNEAIRDISCVVDLARYINNIKSLPEIKNSMIEPIIDKFDVNNINTKSNIVICRTGKVGELTDIFDGISLYEPFSSVVPNFDKIEGNINPKYNCQVVLKTISKLRKSATSNTAIPNPELVPVIKGNVGEYIFQAIIDSNDIKVLSTEEVFELAGSVAYELFDVFILVNKELICIDVKKWASYLDSKERSHDLLSKSERKCEQISSNLKKTWYCSKVCLCEYRLEP
ncbi:hypothetical protein A9Q75_01565 [Colwellia psychrerythraea]|uniref:Uncharacterized protein n=1 Tax=Colwellia psychrerythraea TaxID=28229 RepID=A0A1Y5EPZ8_COLPS|nr:hypothetical protein A9Q75_01565 [Colwellia psychrerythraea]